MQAKLKYSSIAIALFAAFTSHLSVAQDTAQEQNNESKVERIQVTGATSDNYGIMPSEDSSSAFGLDKSLFETPRSLTEVSEDLVDKFALRSVDDLVHLTPGAFTSSFFGIKGAMDIRGEPADNYFRGFKRIANPGAFNTIIRGAEKLEILRGPVSPLYGSGSVGGQLNYIPKSAKVDGSKYIEDVAGDVNVTLGTYDQQILSGSIGIPFSLGGKYGGVNIFAEIEDSGSYFDGYNPSSELVQAAVDIDLSDYTTLEFGIQYQSSDSIQVPGWTRVTQDLIDNGTYITGLPQVLNSDNPIGADTLLPQESAFVAPFAPGFLNNAFSNTGSFCSAAGAGEGNAVYNGFEISCPGAFGNFLAGTSDINPFELTNVGTAQLDHQMTFIDELDFADTTTFTLYFDLSHELSNGMVWKNEAFYDYMDHTKYQSWGFTALYPDAYLFELRSSLNFETEFDGFLANTIIGANYRYEDLSNNAAFFDETFDFRDITVGPTPNDRISPAVVNPYEFANIVRDADGNPTGIEGTLLRNFNERHDSVTANTGLFFLTDITFDKLSIILGGRYDYFDVESEDTWVSYFGQPQGNGVITGSDSAFSYNVSVSYNADGIVPYFTFSETNSLSTNQLGGIIPSTIESSEYLQESSLAEVGVKANLLDGRFYTALSYYDQEKTFRDGQTNALVAVFGKGLEFELRALLTENLSITATATNTDTSEISDGALAVINGADFAAQNGLEAWEVYGGRIAGIRSAFVGNGVELERGGLPDNIASVYTNWSQALGEGEFNASIGVTYVDSTYTDVLQTILLPSYTVWNGSVGYAQGPFSVLLKANNLLDEEYYTSADLFDSVVVKPSEGRTFSVTLSYAF
ncbi:TonB-dependent siderophore receptor [Agaribacter marinus]|uniref:TonB-dependent receptor n=1 Tax=Agaribacter marinus TaxID=1431249 RepID=A0AA37WH26_9ALTE|nr:TonB-dependent receptor plug domain-containing protein [Agaribacter marinus]GLR69453.1 TonB-dependent receptor [Agaribacter marinus]